MTRVGVQQPNYFPWIGYFYKMATVDVFVLLDNVEFQHGNASSVTNRTTIKTDQGPRKITVPVLKTGASRLLGDVRIDTRQPWKRKHVGSLTAAYGRAPAFRELFPEVARRSRPLEIRSLPSMKARSERSAACSTSPPRPSWRPPSSSPRAARTRGWSRSANAWARIPVLSGRGARRYNDEDMFRRNGISVEYSDFVSLPYPQLARRLPSEPQHAGRRSSTAVRPPDGSWFDE